MQAVALLHHRNDGVRIGLGLDGGHRVVAVRVEALARGGIDRLHAGFLERRLELLEREFDPAGVAGL